MTETISLIILDVIGLISISGFVYIWFKIKQSEKQTATVIEEKLP